MTPIAMRRRRRFVQALSAALVLAVGGATMAGASPSPAPVDPRRRSRLRPGQRLLRPAVRADRDSSSACAPEGYRANGATVGDAEPFRAHAAQLGRFMFYGPGGNMLAHDTAAAVVPTRDALPTTDWTLTHTDGGYSITATSNGSQLSSQRTRLTLTDPGANPAGGRFSVVPDRRLRRLPRRRGQRHRHPVDRHRAERRGSRLHRRPRPPRCASEFMGGHVHCGKPFDPQGVTAALQDCPDHGSDGMPAPCSRTCSRTARRSPSTTPPAGRPSRTGPPRLDDPRADLLQVGRAGLARRAADLHRPVRRQPRAVRDVSDQAQLVRRDGHRPDPGRACTRCRTTSTPSTAAPAAAGSGSSTPPTRSARSPPRASWPSPSASRSPSCSAASCSATCPQCTAEDIDRGLDELYAMGVRQSSSPTSSTTRSADRDSTPARTGMAVNIGNFLGTGKFWQAEPCTRRGDGQPEPISPGRRVADGGPAALPPGIAAPDLPGRPALQHARA